MMLHTMPTRPTLVRTQTVSRIATPLARRETTSEKVAANIRRELAMARMPTAVFAQVCGISIARARHIWHDRRVATIAELGDLANALGIPVTDFFREN